MWLRGSLGLFFGGLVLTSSTCSSVSPPVATSKLTPQQSLEVMQVAEGLEVSLFAAEPELRNPTAIDVDAEGRVWVAEAVNYRLFNQDVERPFDLLNLGAYPRRIHRVPPEETAATGPWRQSPLGSFSSQ